jgi:RimJ/RimL family protein N-acetyltransferase
MADAEINPIIRGEKVYLRPFEMSDREAYKRWRADADPMATAEFGYRAPLSDAEVDSYIGGRADQQGKPDYQFVICVFEEDKAIGNIMLAGHDVRRRHAELGIVIGESDYRGKGYGTDAINALLDFAFGELGLERVSLGTLAANEAGQRAYEKAGFKLEGTARSATFNRGKFHDVTLMGLTRADWEKLKRKRSWDYSRADRPKAKRKGTGFRKE